MHYIIIGNQSIWTMLLHLALVAAAEIYAGPGTCEMMMDYGDLFRSSLGCPHNYSREFIKGRVQSVIDYYYHENPCALNEVFTFFKKEAEGPEKTRIPKKKEKLSRSKLKFER